MRATDIADAEQLDSMDSLLISAKEPIRLSSQDLGTADVSLEYCPRAYSKDLLATFPDCTAALKARPECKALLVLAVHKTEMSMASFSPDTGAPQWSGLIAACHMIEQKPSAKAFSKSTSNCMHLLAAAVFFFCEHLMFAQFETIGFAFFALQRRLLFFLHRSLLIAEMNPASFCCSSCRQGRDFVASHSMRRRRCGRI